MGIKCDKNSLYRFIKMISTQVALLSLALLVAASEAGQITWIWAHDDVIECENPVAAGLTHNFTIAYVARVHKGKNVIPGFADLVEVKGAVAYNTPGNPVITNTYEVLCGTGVAWQLTTSGSTFPSNAVPVGELNNQTLYSCRASVEGSNGNFVSGVVDPVTGHCNITVSDTDRGYSTAAHKQIYDVLVELPLKPSGKKPIPGYEWYWASATYTPCPNDSITTGLNKGEGGKGRVTVKPTRTHDLMYTYGGFEAAKKDYYLRLDGSVSSASTYEVLCGGGIAWQPVNLTQSTTLPSGAVVVGDLGGQSLYGCLATVPGENGFSATGGVNPFTKKCELPVSKNGTYNSYNSTSAYEILIAV